MNLFWLCMEWGGVFLALSAAYLMSKNSGQEKLAWCMFLMADVTHVIYYNHTGQTGLVYNQSIGFFISLMGLTVICNKNNKTIQLLVCKLMNMFIILFAFIGIYCGIKWIMSPTINNLEWTAAFMSLIGTSLMASNNKFARFGFFGWLFCDISMLYVAIIKSQFGIILLRVVYILINFNGIKKRFCVKFNFTMFKKKQVAKDNKRDNKNTAISY